MSCSCVYCPTFGRPEANQASRSLSWSHKKSKCGRRPRSAKPRPGRGTSLGTSVNEHKTREQYVECQPGKKTPRSRDTHEGAHGTHGHTDHADEPHNHPDPQTTLTHARSKSSQNDPVQRSSLLLIRAAHPAAAFRGRASTVSEPRHRLWLCKADRQRTKQRRGHTPV